MLALSRSVLSRVGKRSLSTSAKKTILITGAGSGLGAGTALGLAAAGHRVIGTCHIWPQVSEMMAKSKEMGVEIELAKMDVTSCADREMVFKKYGNEVDIVCANAAIGEGGPITEVPSDRVRQQFEVNVFSQLDFVQPYAKEMIKKGAGKICFISSIAGTWTVPFLGPYCMSKHAVEAMAQVMRQELASTGVKVCTINPAPFTTGFNDRNMQTYSQWWDPAKNTYPEQPVKEFAGAMATVLQYDPKLMYDEMVRIIPLDNHRFREMYTPNWEVICKDYHAKLWAMDLDGNVPDDYWGKTEDGQPMPERDITSPPPMEAKDVRPLGL